FDRRALDVEVAAEVGNRTAKRACAMLAEEKHEITVNLPTIDDRRHDHAHGTKPPECQAINHRRLIAKPSNAVCKNEKASIFRVVSAERRASRATQKTSDLG